MTDTTIDNIAGMLYTTHAVAAAAPGTSDIPTWGQYTADAANATAVAAWRKTAADVPAILGLAGVTSVQDTITAASKTTTDKTMSIVYTIIAAALGAVAGIISGCGHDVSISPDGATICKDGACVVIDGDTSTITYSQHSPTPEDVAPAVTDTTAAK